MEDRDLPRASVEVDGQRLRYRGRAQREWPTQFGKITVYRDEDEGPHKSDTRFLARMPESGMKTLVASLADQLGRALDAGHYREFALICDGRESI